MTQMGQLHTEPLLARHARSIAEAITSDQVEISGEVSMPHHYGETVAVAPLDYARDETIGELTDAERRSHRDSPSLRDGASYLSAFPATEVLKSEAR